MQLPAPDCCFPPHIFPQGPKSKKPGYSEPPGMRSVSSRAAAGPRAATGGGLAPTHGERLQEKGEEEGSSLNLFFSTLISEYLLNCSSASLPVQHQL